MLVNAVFKNSPIGVSTSTSPVHAFCKSGITVVVKNSIAGVRLSAMAEIDSLKLFLTSSFVANTSASPTTTAEIAAVAATAPALIPPNNPVAPAAAAPPAPVAAPVPNRLPRIVSPIPAPALPPIDKTIESFIAFHRISPKPVNFKSPIAVRIVVSIGAASKLPFHSSIAAVIACPIKFPADVNTAVQSIPARNCPMF